MYVYTISSIYLTVGKTPYGKRHIPLGNPLQLKKAYIDVNLSSTTDKSSRRILQPEKLLKRRTLQITLCQLEKT